MNLNQLSLFRSVAEAGGFSRVAKNIHVSLDEFADRMERLPIVIVVGADLLRREFDPVA